jgi:hypothetical protein
MASESSGLSDEIVEAARVRTSSLLEIRQKADWYRSMQQEQVWADGRHESAEQRLGRLATRCAELEGALFASRRAMKATRDTLTKTARREVHIYLGAEVEDDEAAAEWYEAALADTTSRTRTPLGNSG